MFEMAKHLHLSAVVISLVLFSFRFLLLINENHLLQKKFLKIFPHVVDTVLLLSAFWLLTMSSMVQVDGWVGSKVIGVVLYILSGLFAFKWAKNNRMRFLGFVSALIWMVVTFGVAFSKQPLSFLA